MHQLRNAMFAAFTLAAVLAPTSAHSAVRAFVSSTGNDANTASSCGATTPCRGFTAAMSVVNAGGEIIALDAAGYGAVTVTKSVSIIANPGVYAGIAASTGTAMTIATAGVTVVLRGLSINNIGAATNGINMTNGSKLVIEDCVISNFLGPGVSVSVAAEVRVANSNIRDNYDGLVLLNGPTATVSGSRFAGHTFNTGGIRTESASGATTAVAISDSVFSGNWIGVYSCASAGGATRTSVTRSTITNNFYGVVDDGCGGNSNVVVSSNLITGQTYSGLYNGGGVTFQSLGNNTGGQNGGNTLGTITTVGGF